LRFNGTIIVGGSANGSASKGFTDNDVVGVATDIDANTIKFFVNGVEVFSGNLPTPGAQMFMPDPANSAAGGLSVHMNAGQQPWRFPPPSGYHGLCTAYMNDKALPANIRCARGKIT
jgi:hypothetical protein